MLCMQKKNVNWTEHYKRKRRASNDSLSFWRFTYYHTLEPSAAPGQRSGMLFFFLLFFQHCELSIVLCFAPVIFVHVTVKMVMMRSVFRINDWNGMERTWKWDKTMQMSAQASSTITTAPPNTPAAAARTHGKRWWWNDVRRKKGTKTITRKRLFMVTPSWKDMPRIKRKPINTRRTFTQFISINRQQNGTNSIKVNNCQCLTFVFICKWSFIDIESAHKHRHQSASTYIYRGNAATVMVATRYWSTAKASHPFIHSQCLNIIVRFLCSAAPRSLSLSSLSLFMQSLHFFHNQNTWLKFMDGVNENDGKISKRRKATKEGAKRERERKKTNWYVRINKNVTFTVNASQS